MVELRVPGLRTLRITQALLLYENPFLFHVLLPWGLVHHYIGSVLSRKINALFERPPPMAEYDREI
jgi:hypothetical protein